MTLEAEIAEYLDGAPVTYTLLGDRYLAYMVKALNYVEDYPPSEPDNLGDEPIVL